MTEPFSSVRAAALAALTHKDADLNYREGQFLGGIAYADRPLSGASDSLVERSARKAGSPTPDHG